MSPLTRGMRNAFRNSIRTFSIVIILGLSVGLALSMLVARQAVSDKIQSVKSSIGNTISVSPAGSRGFQGGGEPLTNEEITALGTIPNVTNVTATLSDRLTASTSNLTSAIDAGSLGNRNANNSGVGFSAPPDAGFNRNGSSQQITRTFTPPVIVTGTNNVSNASVFGGDTIKITSGQAFDPSKDVAVAMLGTSLAAKNNLSVGSTFQVYGTNVTVAAIYDTGNTFSNAGLVMPLATVQRLSGQTGNVTNAVVTVNSIDNMDQVVNNIKSQLGAKADVVSEQTTAQNAVAPLENVKTISLFSLIGALVAGAIIILLTMMMIVRERRREIGVMKAIGAGNGKIMFQFISEAITLTALGLVVGLAIGIAAANPITKVLVNNSTSSQTASASPAGGGGFRAFRAFGTNSVTNVRNIQTSVGINILGYGVLAALGIAIFGSAIPAYFISKVRPAEVMRAE